jgi:hypothetical protein
MNASRSFVFVAFFLTATANDVSAQRGGRSMEVERSETPARFDSQDLGIAFDAPQGVRIYTPAAPGRYTSVLGEGRFVYLEDSAIRNASVVAKFSANATEAELKSYKDILDANPPQSKLEGFKKHSVRFIKIGKQADKEALEFVYDTQAVTIRQVVFIHNGKGVTFTCTSLQAQYVAADAEMFKPVFTRLEFR